MNQWLKLVGCVGAVLAAKVIEALAQREMNKVLTEAFMKKPTTYTKLK